MHQRLKGIPLVGPDGGNALHEQNMRREGIAQHLSDIVVMNTLFAVLWQASKPARGWKTGCYFGPNTSMAIRPALTAQGQPA